MRLADAGPAEEDHVLLPLEEAERVETVELLALDRRLKGEVEVRERLDCRKPRRAHGRIEPSVIAERDLCLQQCIERCGRGERPAIEAREDLKECFERAGHLQISQLRAEMITP